jgi:hypothetical protein
MVEMKECMTLLTTEVDERREVVALKWRTALGRSEVPVVHYLVENKILQHPTHILSSANTLLLIVLPAKQKQNAGIIIIQQIKYIITTIYHIYLLLSAIFRRFSLHVESFILLLYTALFSYIKLSNGYTKTMLKFKMQQGSPENG